MKKYLTFSHIALLAIIIALIILLKRCGNERTAYQRDAHIADSLKQEALADTEKRKAWEMRYHEQQAKHAMTADSAKKAVDSIGKVARSQTAEIRRLYALLSEPIPHDTVEIASKCCEVAQGLAESYESLQLADSIKDHAYLAQIDLATAQVDSLNTALTVADRRYQITDSLRNLAAKGAKPRGSVWVGVEGSGGIMPAAGGYMKYSAPNGKEYSIRTGITPGGVYVGGSVGVKILFKKKRR